MTTWKPISESRIKSLIEEEALSFSKAEKEFFESISIPLQKWSLEPWGNYGGGFWVMGIIDRTVLWYNDIEEGFNSSAFATTGKIDEYWCDQDELYFAVRKLNNFIKNGQFSQKCGPPRAVF